jgi:hypothetical protein
VQRMLGHASAAMTLDTYTDLFDDDLDAVAEALDQAKGASDAVKSQSVPASQLPSVSADPPLTRQKAAKNESAPGGTRTPNRFLRTELLFR